jgi:hypothetical protein
MKNKDGLNPKQWTFCEEYLRNGHNAARAYAFAYPNDRSDNSYKVITRKEVIQYLNKRIQEKQVTLDNLIEFGLTKLKQAMEQGTFAEANAAVKIATEYKTDLLDIEAKLKSLEQNKKQLEATAQVEQIEINLKAALKQLPATPELPATPTNPEEPK